MGRRGMGDGGGERSIPVGSLMRPLLHPTPTGAGKWRLKSQCGVRGKSGGRKARQTWDERGRAT